jgi:hypothetical protein
MKKLFLCSIAAISLFACRKSLKNEVSTQGGQVLHAANFSAATAPGCDIERIVYHTPTDTPGIAKFSYGLHGGPTMVQFNTVSTDRGGHLLFQYDKKRRLTDYFSPMSMDPNTNYAFWYHYTYDQQNRVLVDTCYLFGAIVNGVPQPNETYKSSGNYTYDTLGRITQVRRLYFQNGVPVYVYVYNYAYDGRGNLAGYGPYDDRVNIHRTNKVWQFIDRNYSMNNPATATDHNSFGYPLQFNSPDDMIFAYRIDLRQSEIEYHCREQQ